MKKHERAMQLAGAVVLLILSLGLVEAQFHILRGLFSSRPLGQRELAMRFLGQYLARQYPGGRAIVLSNPFSNLAGQPREIYEYEKAGVRGLRQGLGTAVRIEGVVFPELKPGALEHPRAAGIDRATTTPLSYLVADNALDKVARQYPQAEILVSLIGLPVNVRQTRTWQAAGGKKFALLLPDLRMVGNQAAIGQAVRSGKIAAMVLNKPGAPPEDQPLGRDAQTEFDQRFLLITPTSIERYLQAYPRLF